MLLEIAGVPTAENSVIHLHPRDNIAVARVPIAAGAELRLLTRSTSKLDAIEGVLILPGMRDGDRHVAGCQEGGVDRLHVAVPGKPAAQTQAQEAVVKIRRHRQ